MSIKNFNHLKLDQCLEHLFSVEKKISAKILICLLEISKRKSYLEFGATSMFEYLTKRFKQPPSTAQRWLDNLRMMDAVPEVNEHIQSGELNLTQVSVLAKCLRQKAEENHEIEVSKTELVNKIKNKTVAETQVILSKALDIKIKTSEKKQLQQDESVRYEVTFSKEQMQELDRVKEILSHQHPQLDLSQLVSLLAKEFLKQKDPQRPVQPKTTAMMAQKTIPRPIQRAVHQRDQCCQWKGPNGKCGSRFQLQIDHIQPLWAGGTHELSNLQLLCSVHNREKYRLESNTKIFADRSSMTEWIDLMTN